MADINIHPYERDFNKEFGDRFYDSHFIEETTSRFRDGKLIPGRSSFKIWRSGGVIDGEEICSIIYMTLSNANGETINVDYTIPCINWFKLQEDMKIIFDFFGRRGFTPFDA